MNDKQGNPEFINPAIVGYHRFPPIWCIDAPSDQERKTASPDVFIKTVFETTICGSIKIRVRRDGLFVFDFSNWPDTAETIIPGYIGPKVPREVTAAEELSENRAFYRNIIMNVHQVCVATARYQVHRHQAPVGNFITRDEEIYLMRINQNDLGYKARPNSYWPYSRFLAAMTNFHPMNRSKEIMNRDFLDEKVIKKSYELLEKILTHPFSDLPILVSLLHQAVTRFSQNIFPDSLILSWSICERLLVEAWDRFLVSKKQAADGSVRINKERLKKLSAGRDYTASVIAETLELSEIIPNELYLKIDEARRARNSRLHLLKDVSSSEASNAILTTMQLIKLITNIEVMLTIQRTGSGCGSIPTDLWARHKRGEVNII